MLGIYNRHQCNSSRKHVTVFLSNRKRESHASINMPQTAFYPCGDINILEGLSEGLHARLFCKWKYFSVLSLFAFLMQFSFVWSSWEQSKTHLFLTEWIFFSFTKSRKVVINPTKTSPYLHSATWSHVGVNLWNVLISSFAALRIFPKDLKKNM